MRPSTQKKLAAALRQYRHNDGSPGFVFAYEATQVERLIERMDREIELLRIYGNRDCTAMADEAIAEEGQAPCELEKQKIWRYTTDQPDNLNAWRFGKACNEAARDPKCGDYIDRGLILLKALEELGFGISPIE